VRLDETCILEREIVDRIEKEMSRRAHFLESFSQKRDEIIKYTPTFQGRQKMIKCVRSSRKDLAALERDRTKERERSTSLFLPPKSSFVLPKVGVSEACERSPARRRTSSSSESDRISFFSFFFSLTARTVLTQFFSLSIPQTYV
jgi:hypothetical protein